MKQKQVNKFIEILKNEGEVFFKSGSVEQDYKNIKLTLKTQGYWVGSKYRYYFDKSFNLTDVKERW